MNYWDNEEYYGFGAGAHGYIHGVRYENTRSITDYIKGKYLLKEEMLSKEDVMYNEIILGFRKMDGISLEKFYNKFNVNIQDVFDFKEVLKDDEIIYEDGYLYINPNFIYVMNEILVKVL